MIREEGKGLMESYILPWGFLRFSILACWCLLWPASEPYHGQRRRAVREGAEGMGLYKGRGGGVKYLILSWLGCVRLPRAPNEPTEAHLHCVWAAAVRGWRVSWRQTYDRVLLLESNQPLTTTTTTAAPPPHSHIITICCWLACESTPIAFYLVMLVMGNVVVDGIVIMAFVVAIVVLVWLLLLVVVLFVLYENFRLFFFYFFVFIIFYYLLVRDGSKFSVRKIMILKLGQV